MEIFQLIFKVLFAVILLVPTVVPATCQNCSCPEHTYKINSTTFTWRDGPSSDVWIASNCMNEKKLLIFRKCMDGEWIPDNTLFQTTCVYENVEHPNHDCPNSFHPIQMQLPSQRTICILNKGIQYDFIRDKDVCIQDSIFTLELNMAERTHLIQKLSEDNDMLAVGARWRYPCKEITKYFNHEKDDVQLHDVRCGRFGLLLTFNNTVPINCTEPVCSDLCLYMNVSRVPFSQVIDTCSEYAIARPKNSFLHEIGCPKGYYRTEYDYVTTGNHDTCFSIQMFSQPIPVEDVRNANVIENYCDGTIMTMNWGDDLFIFRELVDQLGLSDGNHCLFSLTSNRIFTYTDWNSSSTPQTPFLFNWDKEMNYSHIISPDTVSYLVVNPNGQWTWAINSVSCIACMVESPLLRAELYLQYNVFERQLVLTVTNQNYLYKEKTSDPGFICHFLHWDVYKSNLTISRLSLTKYLIEDVGQGEYWCSGHNVINRLYIWNGERIFAYGMWFTFEVVRKCATNCSFSREDESRFITFFAQNNSFVKIDESALANHYTAKSEKEYTFSVHLSFQTCYTCDFITKVTNLTDQERLTSSIYEELYTSITYDESREMNINSIKSTQYCLHNVASSIESIIWRVALIGETISISPLCPSDEYNTKITRTCSGDSVIGSFWDEPADVSQCHTFVSESLIQLLKNLSFANRVVASLEYIETQLPSLLLENTIKLLPMDVFLTSLILQRVSAVPFDDRAHIFSIYNTLMQIDDDFVKMSASLNSTNILLEVLDNSLSVYAKSSIIGSSEYQNLGISSIHSSFIETYILDPVVSRASGIALYKTRNSSSSDGFSFYSVRYIYPNQSIDDLMIDEEEITDKELVVGSYLPVDILRLHKNIAVVFTVFFNDKLFQITENVPLEKEFTKIYGHVVSLKVLGLSDSSMLPPKIPIFFKSNEADDASICGHWSSGSINEWSSSGCNVKQILVKNFHRLALCECSLFTYFGLLIKSSINKTVEELVESHDHKQTIFTVVAISFSFFGTLVVILTGVVSKKWRNKLSSKILIHFSVAISLETFVVIAMNFDEQFLTAITSNPFACVAFGSMLHYSVLALTSWMLIFAFFHFKSFIALLNFEVSHLWFQFMIFGWIVPLLPVLIVLVVVYSSYVSINKDELKFCYPTGFALYLGVVTPVTLICLTNFIILITVVASMYKRANSSTVDGTEFKLTLSQIFVSAFLFIDLGLAGIFAVLSKTFSGSLFLYIFYVTVSLQGPAFLLSFIVFDINFIALLLQSFLSFISKRCAQIMLKFNFVLFGENLNDI